jgi:hypothetical protein
MWRTQQSPGRSQFFSTILQEAMDCLLVSSIFYTYRGWMSRIYIVQKLLASSIPCVCGMNNCVQFIWNATSQSYCGNHPVNPEFSWRWRLGCRNRERELQDSKTLMRCWSHIGRNKAARRIKTLIPWTPRPWKASPHHITLRNRRAAAPPDASSKPAWRHFGRPTGEH